MATDEHRWTRIRLFGIVAGLFVASLLGQTTDSKLLIADVHTSPHSSTPNVNMRSGFYKGGRYEVRQATMVDLISLAYGVNSDRILGGPSWLEMDRFDVIALAPGNTTPDAVKAMLQNLLAERFRLVLHSDKKDLPTYALVAGKKPLLKEADGSGETGCTYEVQGQTAVPPTPTLYYTCRNMTMAAFSDAIRTLPLMTQMLGSNPILDETGLKGAWNFEFHFTIAGNGGGLTASLISDVADKQLGLKLEPRKVPTPVILVESANEKPTDNLPGVAAKLPVAPTEFEVADIKPSDPNTAQAPQRSPFLPGGRLELRGVAMKDIIAAAWDTTPDKVVGGPKNLDTDKYDIIAKAPSAVTTVGSSLSNGQQPPIDIDALRLMLKALIIERFKLTTHMEDRPADAYTLVAAKPKMKKADPANRTGFKEGPGSDGKDPRKDTPALGRLVTCQNMTMAQLAQALPQIASGYFQNASTTVIDATGIEGSFDFTLSFSGAGILNKNGGGGRGGDAPPPSAASGGAGEASDPGGGMTLYDAMEKQIGIKMEIQKRPLPVLVIDHIEAKPTDN